MIVRCEGCAAKYFLPESKIPENPVKVRCPQCRAVFTLVPPPKEAAVSVKKAAAPSAPAPPDPPKPQRRAAPAAAPAAAEPPSRTGSGKGSREDARAKRLARVLVSDILCYNQERRDQALLDGNLMTVLGDEIKKSWELYKEKVGAEVAKSTDYFKEALNDILADGQKVF
ncbi:MAG: zinc-ribbon domain-containing protein [Candidatus Krumholzibacteriia bacterium]